MTDSHFPSKVVITNCWSYYNKGDAAIAQSTIRFIRDKNPDAEITLLAFDEQGFIKNRDKLDFVKVLPMPSINDSLRPLRILSRLASSLGLEDLFGSVYLLLALTLLQPFKRFDRKLDSILHAIETSELVIVVGGNYIYSHFGFYVHAIPIFYSKFVQKKVTIMLGHSIGPFKGTIVRIVSRYLLNQMDFIVFRERISHDYVKSNLQVKNPNMLTLCDMAFLLPSSTPKKSDSLRVGVTVRPWLFDEPSLYRQYIETITHVTIDLIKDGFEVYLIPFSYVRGSEDDLVTCKLIFTNLSKVYPERIFMIDVKEESPQSLTKIIGNLGLKILIATRMHSAILSSLCAVPSVIISYQHPKAFGISEQLELSTYVLRIEKLEPELLTTTIKKLLNSDKAVENLVSAVKRLKDTNEPIITELFCRVLEFR